MTEYSVRKQSGGAGIYGGGDGIVREIMFLEPASVSLLTERRLNAPWGLAGGEAGKVGVNRLNGKSLKPKVNLTVKTGDCLRIETPGGGGHGAC